MKGHRLVIGIYYHPEAYPPTLNAVQELSKCFEHITIVHRPHLKGSWKYPENVKAVASGNFVTGAQQERSTVTKKVLFFRKFMADLLRAIRSERASVVLLYDVHALFAYRMIRPLIGGKHIAWYHNHDVSELERERKYSIGWFACKTEKKIFKDLDIFTLPTADRLRYFSMNTFKGKQFVVPNYPSLHFYGSFYKPKTPGDVVRLIFQGRIGEGHGFEEIIPLLSQTINGKQLQLVLKGYCDEDYKQRLTQLAGEHRVADRLIFAGFTAYEEVPKLSASCHIGIGIFAKHETMHITLGTASNKLYEYAAVGLPILYLNEPHFSQYLKKYEWAIPVQLNTASIREAIETIISNYAQYSAAAYGSFRTGLNFEGAFSPVMNYLRDKGYCTR
jgi:hypothetical protein